ncbi:hypothetical protein [Acidianus sp. RZ1]|uniref:hypothetical protein n=1 Tax=Acidianus sp. RZ1 TaxID=1540082 RepID=UPI0020A29A17|nr:hypothetical protein [Acidianus sp. RZ1]
MDSKVINVGMALVGEELEPLKEVNIEITDGIVTHIGNGYQTGEDFRTGIALPTLVNSHTHSADFIEPEFGIDKSIKELVGDPSSEKYRILKSKRKIEIVKSIEKFLNLENELGISIVVDFREEGIYGSTIVNDLRKLNWITYKVLGRLEKDEFNDYNLRKYIIYPMVTGYQLQLHITVLNLRV